MVDTDHQRNGLLAVAARTLLLFQALFTGLCMLLMAWNLFLNIDDAYVFPKDPPFQKDPHLPKDPPLPPTYSPEAYPVVRQLFLVVFAAMILCIIYIQWNHADPHHKTAARLELVKGLLATATWSWLLLDVIFFVPKYPYEYFDPYWRYRRRKIIFMATSIIVLCS